MRNFHVEILYYFCLVKQKKQANNWKFEVNAQKVVNSAPAGSLVHLKNKNINFEDSIVVLTYKKSGFGAWQKYFSS